MNQQSKLDTVDPKYQQTLIYGIQCMTTGEMYVGSTHRTLDVRIAQHIRKCDCSAIQILDRGTYKVYEIQRWPCNTKREVLTLEGGWQKAYKASFGDFLVNKQIEGTFQNDSPEAKQAYTKQYREEHKDEMKVYSKQYREEHKDEIKVYTKKYYSQPWTCEWCDKTMTTGARPKHKKRCTLKPVVHEAQKGC
jgi:hypothetical protein